MTKQIIIQEIPQGYDIIRATFRDFRQLLRKYVRSFWNQHYFQMLLEYIQFMQTDDIFNTYFEDIQQIIEEEMDKAGVDLEDFYTRVFEEITGNDCLWAY